MKQLITCALLLFSFHSANAQYTIMDVFGDLDECDTMTRNGFIVWWDVDFDMEESVIVLLDSLDQYRETCLTDLGMADPPNLPDGHYYNIYATNGGDYFAPNGWGQGQGTDSNGYPFLTLPNLGDEESVAHEIFHIFQYSATSPGFAYSGDSQWYIEAAANWFAARVNPEAPRAFIEGESLVRISHVPLWLSFDNFPDDYPPNWQRYVHQYALASLLYYMTDVEDVSPDIVAGGLYAGTEDLPQEYFFNSVGEDEFRQLFMNWAAHITNDFDFLTPTQRISNETEWSWYAEPWDDNEYIQVYGDEGSGGWYRPDDSVMTHAWSFNTYKLSNTSDQSYLFEIRGDEAGTYDDPSHFEGRVIVQGEEGVTIYSLDMLDDQNGALTLDLTSTDETIYFVIGSTPDVFEDESSNFQKFGYDMRIISGTASLSELEGSATKQEIGRFNLLGQPIPLEYEGVHIIQYDDGSTTKTFRTIP